MALLTEETCEYTIVVDDGEPLDVMTLSRKDVTALLGPLHRLIVQREQEDQDNADDDAEGERGTDENSKGKGNERGAGGGGGGGGGKKGKGASSSSNMSKHWTVRQAPEVCFEELRTLATLCENKGEFSTVRMVVHKPSGTVYALKSFSRPACAVMGLEGLPMREKLAQTTVNHPFVLKLVNTYKNAKKLYLLSEFVHGGELYHRIHPPDGGRSRLDELDARFYAASVTLALGYMHSRSVVYRGLTPENGECCSKIN